jgi:hypothetical protein
MANESIYRAFEREHEHITLALNNLQATTKQYVDDKIASSGGGNYEKHLWIKSGCPIPSSNGSWYTRTGTTQSMVTTAVASSLEIADSIEINIDGSSKLVNPRTFSWTHYGGNNYGVVTDSEGVITTFPALFTYLESTKTRPYYFIGYDQTASMRKCMRVTSATTFNPVTTAPYGLTIGTSYDVLNVNTTWDTSKVGYEEIIYTTSATAYTEGPDGNGYTYGYLGVPSDVYPEQITQTGTYTGTGGGVSMSQSTYPSDEFIENAPIAVSITFARVPTRVTIYKGNTIDRTFYIPDISTSKFTSIGTLGSNSDAKLYACFRGTTLSWKCVYKSNSVYAESISNKANTVYTWEAI